MLLRELQTSKKELTLCRVSINETKTKKSYNVLFVYKKKQLLLYYQKKSVILQSKAFWCFMPAYLKKAHDNVKVAEFLVDNGLFKSSAHPAYYSAFLSIKYILAHSENIDYEAQDAMTSGKDSHNVLKNLALPIMAKKDPVTSNDYLVWYNKLKKMRKLADYKNDEIPDEDLIANLDVAKVFMQHVDSYIKTA